VTDSADQARSQAWSLWSKLTAPALLRCPVLGVTVVLAVSTPFAAEARTLPRSQESATAAPTQRQLRVLRSYERYVARMRAQSVKASQAVRFAYRQVGKPYRWGGAGPHSYDCSGLVMAAWRKGGLRLPHRADLQHRMIRRKVSLKHLRPGDLVFFSGDHHVGIYVGHHHFLHAPHTGARVQRGTLSGWRLRAFAGAARPGAPAYHAWPHWVRALAEHGSGHGAEKAHHRHGTHEADAKARPATTRPDDAPELDTPPTGAIPEPGDAAGDQAPVMDLDTPPPPPPPAPEHATEPGASAAPSTGQPAGSPSGQPAGPPAGPSTGQPAGSPAAPPAGSPAASSADQPAGPSGTHGAAPAPRRPAPVAVLTGKPPVAAPGKPPVAGKPVRPAPDGTAQRPSAHGLGGVALPLISMVAPTPRSRHDAVAADGTPVPPPDPRQNPRHRPRWPRNSVQQRNDEQRIDRVFTDTDADGADDDADPGDDGLDLRSLLGSVP
jgi:cell wall-associated NlpC family hydrolase